MDEKTMDKKSKNSKTVKLIKGMIKKMSLLYKIIFLSLIVIIVLSMYFTIKQKILNPDRPPEIISESKLYKIINVSELSTYQCVYNDVCTVKDSEDPNKILYYVSYESKVNAGIDFSKVDIALEEKTDKESVIKITIPKATINDILVDTSSFEFMWEEKKQKPKRFMLRQTKNVMKMSLKK